MEIKEEFIKKLIDNFEYKPPQQKGGQQCGINTTIELHSPELGISVKCGSERSHHRNRNVATKYLTMIVTDWVNEKF